MMSERYTTKGIEIKVHYRGWNVRYDTYLPLHRIRVCNEVTPNDDGESKSSPVSDNYVCCDLHRDCRHMSLAIL